MTEVLAFIGLSAVMTALTFGLVAGAAWLDGWLCHWARHREMERAFYRYGGGICR